jgi:hypothetical protein
MNTTSLARVALASTWLLSAGCGSDEPAPSTENPEVDPTLCDEETRDEPFVDDMSKTGETVSVTLLDSQPAPPGMGDNVWDVRVTDLQGAPMDLLDPMTDLIVSQIMPGHPDHVMVHATATRLAAGEYRLDPVSLPMHGYWEIRIDVVPPGGNPDSVLFKFCVE